MSSISYSEPSKPVLNKVISNSSLLEKDTGCTTVSSMSSVTCSFTSKRKHEATPKEKKRNSKSTQRKKNKLKKKNDRSLILHTLIVKGLIHQDEEFMNVKVNLLCINTGVSKTGRLQHWRLEGENLTVKDANLSNVVWELFISGTGSFKVDFTYLQLKEALRKTTDSDVFKFPIFDLDLKSAQANDSTSKESCVDDTTKKDNSTIKDNKSTLTPYTPYSLQQCDTCHCSLPDKEFISELTARGSKVTYLETESGVFCHGQYRRSTEGFMSPDPRARHDRNCHGSNYRN